MLTVISYKASIGFNSDVDYMEQLFWLMINKIQEICHLSKCFFASIPGTMLTAKLSRGCSTAHYSLGVVVSVTGPHQTGLCAPRSRD